MQIKLGVSVPGKASEEIIHDVVDGLQRSPALQRVVIDWYGNQSVKLWNLKHLSSVMAQYYVFPPTMRILYREGRKHSSLRVTLYDVPMLDASDENILSVLEQCPGLERLYIIQGTDYRSYGTLFRREQSIPTQRLPVDHHRRGTGLPWLKQLHLHLFDYDIDSAIRFALHWNKSLEELCVRQDIDTYHSLYIYMSSNGARDTTTTGSKMPKPLFSL